MASPIGRLEKAVYDDALIGILSNEGQITPFLDQIFSFLYRRTDFFKPYVDGKEGFSPGVARGIVEKVFSVYEAEAAKHWGKQQSNQEPLESRTTLKCPSKTTANHEHDCNAMDTKSRKNESTPPVLSSEVIPAEPDENNKNLRQWFQSRPESYNGAVRDKYAWSQNITEVDVRVPVSDDVRKGRDVTVTFRPDHLHVSTNTSDKSGPHNEVLVDGELCWRVKHNECYWNLEPGKAVMINLEKVDERWWEALLKDEEKIDVTKIDCSRPITDLEPEAQYKLEQAMYDENQKRLGKPTSEEKKMEDMLRQAWDAPGSPFKGTPFDPSKVNLGGGGAAFLPGSGDSASTGSAP